MRFSLLHFCISLLLLLLFFFFWWLVVPSGMFHDLPSDWRHYDLVRQRMCEYGTQVPVIVIARMTWSIGEQLTEQHNSVGKQLTEQHNSIGVSCQLQLLVTDWIVFVDGVLSLRHSFLFSLITKPPPSRDMCHADTTHRTSPNFADRYQGCRR